MDAWGRDGCLERLDEITDRIRVNCEKLGGWRYRLTRCKFAVKLVVWAVIWTEPVEKPKINRRQENKELKND